MQYSLLGRTGLKVSRLCFGALTIGPLQANLPHATGVAVIKQALDAGVNFIDTAELYQTYDYICEAIKNHKNDVIISSKSYAYSYDGMKKSVHNACKALCRDYVDIFMLHEQSSRLTLKGHREALDFLITAKREGIIRAIGVSTHTVEVVKAAAMIDEIDIIHPILNIKGIGICDGTIDDMLAAIDFAAYMGKGIYSMKALGGGHLNKIADEAFKWILMQRNIAAVAVGMKSVEEVLFNVAMFNGLPVDMNIAEKVSVAARKLLVEDWCIGCGNCVKKCPMKALSIVDGNAYVDNKKCVLCGYCGAYCPQFCIKIV